MTLPRENLTRALVPGSGYEVRDADGDGKPPTLTGHFAVFDQWTEIDSMFEGHFMERIAPGSFNKTFQEKRDRIKPTFNHGHDPDLGDKVLGKVSVLEEDSRGAKYEVPLFPSVPPLLVEGLREGVYGSSFRFRVTREEVDEEPERSEHNPDGLPERTIKEVELFEFGPVTFPAYEGATAGVRSLTDEEHFAKLTKDPKRLAEIIDYTRKAAEREDPAPAPEPPPEPAQQPPAPAAATPEPVARTKEDEPMAVDIDRFTDVGLIATRQAEIQDRKRYLYADAAGKPFAPEVQTEWDELLEESRELQARKDYLEKTERELNEGLSDPTRNEPGDDRAVQRVSTPDRRGVTRMPENVYDLTAYRQSASTPGQEARMLVDGARKAIEQVTLPMGNLSIEETRSRAMTTLERLEHTDEDNDSAEGRLASYLLAVGSPSYRRAFGKFAMAAPAQAMFMPEEAAAIQQAKVYAQRAFTLASTGLPVPFQLDPTIIPVSNGSVNPYRQIARVVQTTVKNWRGATSAGITAHYDTEALEATDDTPTLTQPTIDAIRATAFVPFSIEVDQDWGEVQAEMGQEVADAKDDLEATKFTLGSGTNEPFGLITGATTLVITTTTGTFVVADTYKLEEAVPPRFRPRSSVVGNRTILNKVRQFDTAGGSAVWLDVPGLAQNLPTANGAQMPRGVLGYPTYEVSAMDAVLTTGSEILVMGDFRYFIIVDRVGMSADLIPHLVGANHRPTGQRGLYFFWRNGSKVAHANAFRTLQT